MAAPRLVVIISIDQFRYDYLTRFSEHFGRGGFNYLLDEGASFSNATFKHALNLTGAGHAVIASGSYGSTNGIIANNWYDGATRRNMYCVQDDSVRIVGARGPGKSPRNLIGSTFGDVLRMSTAFQSKVISVAGKDRAAILMGGHLANGVYWMAESLFVSSTYYMNDLPQWVQNFNRSGTINSYYGRVWEKVLPEDAYAMQDVDDAPYEDGGNGLGTAFPHRITGDDPSRLTGSYYHALGSSPFASEILDAFVREAIRSEKLGQRNVTDLLCIGFSANDIVGHAFGPNSHEVLDMTARTDRMLEGFFAFLDEEVGLRHCVIVLTSDHGVAPIPEFVLKHKHDAPAGRLGHARLEEYVNASLTKAYGALKKNQRWLDRIANNSIHLNPDALHEKKLTVEAAARVVAGDLITRPEIAVALTRSDLSTLHTVSDLELRMKRSFHPARSGDVFFALKPYYISDSWSTGTTHGQPYDYDAHVPVIFVGDGIRRGAYATEASPADIAPTLSALLGIEFPAGREGRVLVEALDLR